MLRVIVEPNFYPVQRKVVTVGSRTKSVDRTDRAQLVYPINRLLGIKRGAIVSNVGERNVALMSSTKRTSTITYIGSLVDRETMASISLV